MSVGKKRVVIIGAGPAGITAGTELLSRGAYEISVLERDAVVGGLARTLEYKGCRFDIGPHHFITHDANVQKWWETLMAGDFHTHKRYTRIYYNNHFFNYPLDPLNVITGLSLIECIKCVMSYVKQRLFPIKKVTSFQDWITNRFGYRLFSMFFKTYTEKVWGIPCNKISSDWAAQRIKGFSLGKAIFYAFFGRWFKKNAPRTIQDTFYYPSRGAGTLWEKAAKRLEQAGATITLGSSVVGLEHDGTTIRAVLSKQSDSSVENAAVSLTRHEVEYVFSTMPLRALIQALDPVAPAQVVHAAQALQYRGLITVNLIINKAQVIPDHWLYVHEKKVRMGRIGNMNNFSLAMVDHPEHTALSLEYFAFVDEPLWHKTEAELIELGIQELEIIKLVERKDVLDGMVLKTPEAYPVYDAHYLQYLSTVLEYTQQFTNLQLMGRNGMHRYNNMDIAMLSAMKAVDTVCAAEDKDYGKELCEQTHQNSAPSL